MRARLIKTDGTTEALTFPPEDGWDHLCKLLGTEGPTCLVLVTLAPGRPGLAMWYDADALFTEATANRLAVKLANWVARTPVPVYIAGDVVLTGAPGAIDKTHPLTGGQDDVLASMLTRWKRDVEVEKVAADARGTMFSSMVETRA